MYPNTESATDDRRQADIDEHRDRTRDDQLDQQLDRDQQLDEGRRDEPYGDVPAGQHDYAAGDTADADRPAEYGEPAAGQEGYAQPAGEHGQAPEPEYAEPTGERGQASEYTDTAYRHDQPAGSTGSTGFAEPERAERPPGDLRDEPAAAATDEALADRPAAQAPTYASTGAYTGPTERPPQSTGEWQLFGTEHVDNLRSRWSELQGSFVDDPRQAVEQAEQLVSEVVRTVTDRFHERRKELQTQSADTEELRLAIHRYRAFFRQLIGG